MKKLGKKLNTVKETIETYTCSTCVCNYCSYACSGFCSSSGVYSSGVSDGTYGQNYSTYTGAFKI